jgi:hypothetical protein
MTTTRAAANVATQHHDDYSDEDVAHRVHCVPSGPDAGQFTEV